MIKSSITKFSHFLLDCLVNSDCSDDEQCINKTCVNPCENYNDCGKGTGCKVIDRVPECLGKFLYAFYLFNCNIQNF